MTDYIGLYYQTVRYHAHREVLAGLIEPAEQPGRSWRLVQAASICG